MFGCVVEASAHTPDGNELPLVAPRDLLYANKSLDFSFAWYNIWLLIKFAPKGVVFSFLFLFF